MASPVPLDLHLIDRQNRPCDLDIVEDSLGITPSSAGYKYIVHIVSQAIWHENAISKQGSTRHHVKSSVTGPWRLAPNLGAVLVLLKLLFKNYNFHIVTQAI